MFKEIDLPFAPSVVIMMVVSLFMVAMVVSFVVDIRDAATAPPMTTVVLLQNP